MDMKARRIMVSACLMGLCCRYDGAGKECPAVAALAESGAALVPVCPEQLGGLPTPRTPAEIQKNGRVVTADGRDVTEQYLRGAREAARLAAKLGCGEAVLKARSPSCGGGEVYDGTFSGTLTKGWGFAARALRDAGVLVMTEEDLAAGKAADENGW